jgi:CRISPR type IV-associated protein Csf3
MESLKVTFTFSSPVVVPEYPIHLDALLAWAKVEEAKDQGSENPFPAQESLPLGTYGGIWQASALAFTPVGTSFFIPLTRKFDINSLANDQGLKYEGKKNKFTQGSGKFKGYNLMMHCRWMLKAEAWGIGDLKEVVRLLSSVTSISNYRRIGYGEVASCKVTLAKDQSLWMARNVPTDTELLPGILFARAQQNLRSPYWERTSFQEVFCPIGIEDQPEIMFFG